MPTLVNKFSYIVLSDPKKRDYYDRHGKLDEDDFNFEEFMKGFNINFSDIFADFDGKNLFVKFFLHLDDGTMRRETFTQAYVY